MGSLGRSARTRCRFTGSENVVADDFAILGVIAGVGLLLMPFAHHLSCDPRSSAPHVSCVPAAFAGVSEKKKPGAGRPPGALAREGGPFSLRQLQNQLKAGVASASTPQAACRVPPSVAVTAVTSYPSSTPSF